MSKHHLRTKAVDREECVYLCRDCHGFIHALFTTRQIADPRNGLDTIPGLMARSEFRKAISFVQSVPVGRKVAIAKSRKRKRNTRGRRK